MSWLGDWWNGLWASNEKEVAPVFVPKEYDVGKCAVNIAYLDEHDKSVVAHGYLNGYLKYYPNYYDPEYNDAIAVSSEEALVAWLEYAGKMQMYRVSDKNIPMHRVRLITIHHSSYVVKEKSKYEL